MFIVLRQKSRFPTFAKKTTKSEPKSSSNELKTTKNDKKRQKVSESSPNELKTTKNDKKRQKVSRKVAQMSSKRQKV